MNLNQSLHGLRNLINQTEDWELRSLLSDIQDVYRESHPEYYEDEEEEPDPSNMDKTDPNIRIVRSSEET